MATEAEKIDVNSFLPKKSAKKRSKPAEEENDDVQMTVVDQSTGIEGKVKSTSGSKAKRVKKADSMKIAVPIKRFVVVFWSSQHFYQPAPAFISFQIGCPKRELAEIDQSHCGAS